MTRRPSSSSAPTSTSPCSRRRTWWGRSAEAVGIFNYTVLPGGRLIAPEPSWVRAHISTRTVPILGQVTCNNAIFPQLEAALREVVERGLADEIHPGEYAGCYYPRFIAGTTQLSNHSFGLALDLNVPGNQRGTVGEMDRTVVVDLRVVGLHLGRSLALHRPDALRGQRDRQPRLVLASPGFVAGLRPS